MFTVGGLVSLPLAVAIGQLHQVGSVGIVLVVIAGCAAILGHATGRLRRASQRGLKVQPVQNQQQRLPCSVRQPWLRAVTTSVC